MTPWRRWRFRAESRTMRDELVAFAQRLDRTEQRINDLEKRLTQLTTQVASRGGHDFSKGEP